MWQGERWLRYWAIVWRPWGAVGFHSLEDCFGLMGFTCLTRGWISGCMVLGMAYRLGFSCRSTDRSQMREAHNGGISLGPDPFSGKPVRKPIFLSTGISLRYLGVRVSRGMPGPVGMLGIVLTLRWQGRSLRGSSPREIQWPAFPWFLWHSWGGQEDHQLAGRWVKVQDPVPHAVPKFLATVTNKVVVNFISKTGLCKCYSNQGWKRGHWRMENKGTFPLPPLGAEVTRKDFLYIIFQAAEFILTFQVSKLL